MKEAKQLKTLMETVARLTEEERKFKTLKDIFNDPWGYRAQLNRKAEEIAASIDNIYFSEDSIMDAREYPAVKKQFMETFRQMQKLDKMLDKVLTAAKNIK